MVRTAEKDTERGKAMTQNTEFELVKRAQAGDQAAFDALITENQTRLYNVALRMTGNSDDAQDMVQEALIKAWRSLASFRGDSRFSVWLYRICKNCCKDLLRKNRQGQVIPIRQEDEDGEELELQIPDEELAPDKLLERKLTRDAVRRGLEQLPEDHRRILLLREIGGMSYEEIAECLSLEVGTVKSRIFRARKKLCEFLVRDGNIPDRFTSKYPKGG